MSRTSSRPEDHPNQRRAARNVSRASSWPDSTGMSMPLRSRIAARTSSPLTASRIAEVANATTSSTPLSSAMRSASSTKACSRSAPSLGQAVAVVDVGGEPQFVLVGERGQRRRALVCVHHQQMHGIGAHIEDTESHGLDAIGSA